MLVGFKYTAITAGVANVYCRPGELDEWYSHEPTSPGVGEPFLNFLRLTPRRPLASIQLNHDPFLAMKRLGISDLDHHCGVSKGRMVLTAEPRCRCGLMNATRGHGCGSISRDTWALGASRRPFGTRFGA